MGAKISVFYLSLFEAKWIECSRSLLTGAETNVPNQIPVILFAYLDESGSIIVKESTIFKEDLNDYVYLSNVVIFLENLETSWMKR